MKNKLDKIEDNYKEEFIESWNLIENFYSEYPDDNSPFTDDALKLIKEMRNLSLDNELRAGQSLWFLLLSRNRNYGIDKEPHIRITFLGENKMIVNSNFNSEKTSQELNVNYKGYLENITNKLLKENIIWNAYDIDESDSMLNFPNNE